MLNVFRKSHFTSLHSRRSEDVILLITSVRSTLKGLVKSFNKHQCRNFYIMSNDYIISNSLNDTTKISESGDAPQAKQKQIGYFWKHYSKNITYKQRCALRVAEALDCFEHKGVAICDDHPRLFLDEIDATVECINKMVDEGLPKSIIRNNLWILYFTKSDLCSRLNAMKQWNVSHSELLDMIVLIGLPYTTFYKITSLFIEEKHTVPRGNRIIYLSDLLECPVNVMAEKFVKNKYLLTRNVDLIVSSIRAYQDFGIPVSEIIRDSWCLRYTDSVIRRRLGVAAQENISPLKPWMVRCSDEIFQNVIQAHRTEQKMLKPFKTREEYLSNKLGIELSIIKVIVDQKSIFRSARIDKLQAVINFLLKVGYSGNDICSCPRVFTASIDTTMERFNELKSLGVEVISLYIMIKSETEYRKLVERVRYYYSHDKDIMLNNM